MTQIPPTADAGNSEDQTSEDQSPLLAGVEIAGLFDPNAHETLSSEERSVVGALLGYGGEVSMAIPDNINMDDLWTTLDICSRVFTRSRQAGSMLKLLIGRILMVIQANPEVYESRGFGSFSSFMGDKERGLPHITGISRAELFKAMSAAKGMSADVSLDDIRQIGFTKAQMIAGATAAGSNKQREYIEHAKTETIPQLQERMVRDRIVAETGDVQWDVLQIQLTKTQKRFILSFLDDQEVKAYCETDSYAMILERAVAEVMAEWTSREVIIEGEERS